MHKGPLCVCLEEMRLRLQLVTASTRKGCLLTLRTTINGHGRWTFAVALRVSPDLKGMASCSNLSALNVAGAGVAALLAMHYRNVFPGRVKAWCFAPPGGLLSPAAAESLEDICYSLVSAKVSLKVWVSLAVYCVITRTACESWYGSVEIAC